MRRSIFVTSALAALGSEAPLWAAARALEGGATTQGDLFAALPRARARQWTRIILGSGAQYQKQIGAGIEVARDGTPRSFFETQVGSPGGSCNPSSMRKSYLRTNAFGSLLATYPLLANIGRTENLVYRFGDLADGAKPGAPDTTLRLLEEPYLYDARPMVIESVSRARIHVASRDVETTHVTARYGKPASKGQRLRAFELWHAPDFPFGVAKYHAVLDGLDPFEAHVYSHGEDFASILSLTLAQVRAITPNGTYGQLPQGIGA